MWLGTVHLCSRSTCQSHGSWWARAPHALLPRTAEAHLLPGPTLPHRCPPEGVRKSLPLPSPSPHLHVGVLLGGRWEDARGLWCSRCSTPPRLSRPRHVGQQQGQHCLQPWEAGEAGPTLLLHGVGAGERAPPSGQAPCWGVTHATKKGFTTNPDSSFSWESETGSWDCCLLQGPPSTQILSFTVSSFAHSFSQ